MNENEKLFRFWINQGIRYRRRENPRMDLVSGEYQARIKLEYDVIVEKDFIDYFLIVSDLVRYAKDSGIAVGPGRGSSVGSLICYLLRITEIDSLQFPVLFERFLDPTRTDPPDIDVDFDDSRRDELFEYAEDKYKYVANIGTYTRYKGRNSLDDVARVYHIPKWKVEAVKDKLLDRAEGHPRFSKSVVDTHNSFPDVRAMFESTPQFRYAANLEGNIQTFGVHAAALVISTKPLEFTCATYEKTIGGQRGAGRRPGTNRVPSSKLPGKSRERQGSVIAFDKYDAASIGLLKIDLLSLTTLGMIADICELAGVSINELYRKPLTDKTILKMFADGDVLGIFQFEGITTRRILKDVAPTEFMHLSDVNALARPGAQDVDYIRNKRNGGEIHYVHPILRQHLSWTYGVIVYEEQILMVLRDIGGFAPKELNRMRKIIHDKLGDTAFNEYHSRFINGAKAHNISEANAGAIWNAMVNASGYAFNVAHSVSYSHIAYWAAWLKLNHTPQFFTALLSRNGKGDDERRAKIIRETERHGIKVLPPKILESGEDWTLGRDEKTGATTILAGFGVIKGIGPQKIESIIAWGKDFDRSFGDPEIDDLIDIKGIGKETVKIIKEFVFAEDPFKIGHMQRVLNETREQIARGDFPNVPIPTHISIDIPKDKQWVVFTGIIRERKYYDAAVQASKRNPNLSEEEAYQQLKDKHLLKYVALYCEDEYGEQVRVSVNRWIFPKFKHEIEDAKMDRDIVVVEGFSSDFQGISINAKRLVVFVP